MAHGIELATSEAYQAGLQAFDWLVEADYANPYPVDSNDRVLFYLGWAEKRLELVSGFTIRLKMASWVVSVEKVGR